MGMFDYVNCKKELPDGYELKPDSLGDSCFQTKDFACVMETIVIDENGMVKLPPFHFYGGNPGEWREYRAEVTGFVTKIERVDSDA